MMVRVSGVVWMLVIVAAAFGLYLVKYRVQDVRDQVTELARQLDEEREALHVARAEWAYLNRPQRLASLTTKHHRLAPLQGAQIADFKTIPYSQPPLNAAAVAAAGGAPEGEGDDQ